MAIGTNEASDRVYWELSGLIKKWTAEMLRLTRDKKEKLVKLRDLHVLVKLNKLAFVENLNRLQGILSNCRMHSIRYTKTVLLIFC
jgi:hypothetical protein